jgi:hypothetical protein
MKGLTALSNIYYRIALDPGFHGIKVATVLQDQILTYTLPALVGVGETNLGMLQTGITRQRRSLPFLVEMDGQSYLAGPHVAQYARPIERLDFNRLTYSLELRALIYTALANLLNQIAGKEDAPDVYDLGLILALPVQVLQNSDVRETTQALESWLVGEHCFGLDHRTYRLNIWEIKTMAQPMGAFFEWGLDYEGQWGRSTEELKASVGVLDQGFNTTDLIHIHRGQIIKRFTSGETLGQRRAARLMQEMIEQRTGRKMTLHEADALVRQTANGSNAPLIVRGERFDLKPLARQALDVAAGELRAYLSQAWEDGQHFDYILLTGGGVLALGRRLLNIFPQIVELNDPVTVNARGLARFAQRRGTLEKFPNRVA